MSRKMTAEREAVARAKRIVVKIGSRSLATAGDTCERIARDVAELRAQGRSVLVVSSGAIALGWQKLGYKARPKEVKKLQAAAAAGQSSLMRAYEQAFAPHGIPVAQVLLTHADLADRARANNARESLIELLVAGAVPVLNENDSVAVEEIKFGDNDQLAAMVAPLVGADLLLLLSDVAGVLDGEGERVRQVTDTRDLLQLVKKSTSTVGTGGMGSKIEAARRAAISGAHAIIADAREPRVLSRIAQGDDVGTLVVAAAERLSARKAWIAFTLRPAGDVVLDAGATRAVRDKNKSVLSVGVLGVRGTFREGDAVRLLDGQGAELGRGLARAAAEDVMRAAGTPGETDGVVVHKDELVLWPSS